MPQQELWAASARTTGIQFTYARMEEEGAERSLLSIRPLWSKTPTGRDGSAQLLVPDYAVWDLPIVFRAAFEQYLGGQAKHVGTSARSALRDVLVEFADGARM
jgi:hypothetical protein